MDGFAELFAAGGVIELPFAPPGMPKRLEGREAIRSFSAGAGTSLMQIEDMWATQVYETTDPEVLIVELETKAVVTTTGASFQSTSVQVFRIRDGEILLLRDYWNPQGLAEALNDPTRPPATEPTHQQRLAGPCGRAPLSAELSWAMSSRSSSSSWRGVGWGMMGGFWPTPGMILMLASAWKISRPVGMAGLPAAAARPWPRAR